MSTNIQYSVYWSFIYVYIITLILFVSIEAAMLHCLLRSSRLFVSPEAHRHDALRDKIYEGLHMADGFGGSG